MAVYFPSGGNPYLAITDPSSTGGVCRAKCDTQPDPWACCRTKATIPNCRDSECNGAVYTGNKALPNAAMPHWSYPAMSRPPTTECKAWAPCSTTANPKECCSRKPPGCDVWCNFYGHDNPVLPLPGSDCRTWTPCMYNPSPKDCCALKPAGCDPWCHAQGYSSTHPPVYKPTYPPTGDCRNWPACAGTSNPNMCCGSKPPGCDPDCRDYRFVRRVVRRVTPTYVGSSFNTNNVATDRLYGVDKGYVGDMAL